MFGGNYAGYGTQGGKKKPLKAPKKDTVEFEDDKEFKQKQAQVKR